MSRSSSPGKSTPCDYHPYQNYTWIQLHEVVVDKEYQLECARDELQKLSVSEQEGKRKDEVIAALRREIAEYKKCTQSGDIKYASMEERVSSSESHLKERIKEVQMLQLELESVREQLRSSASKSTALRKERSKLSQWEDEVRELRKQQRTNEESIATLNGELAEKKKNLQSMQERLKKFRSENQEVKNRLESVQAVQESMTTREKELKAEIAQLKSQASNAHLLQAKYNFSEQELVKAKDKENTMAVQLGRLESELSEVCGHILASFQVSRTDSGHRASPQAAFQAVTQFAESYFKTEEGLALCEQDLEKDQHREDLLSLNTDILYLCKCWKEFQEGVKVDRMIALNALAESLQKPVTSEDEDMKELLDMMREGTNALLVAKDQSEKRLTHLESHIKSCYEGLTIHEGHIDGEDVVTMVSNMRSSLQSSLSQVAKLKERLVGAELEHSASLSGAVTALRQDENKRMTDAVEKIKSEEEERLRKELADIKELHTFEKEEAILQEQETSAVLRKELKELKLTVESEREERAAEKAKLLNTETKLLAAELSKSEAISEVGSYKEMLQQQFSEQISEFKEQAQQYALTIVAMEEKLLKLIETCKTLKAENQSLTKRLEGIKTSSTSEIQNRDEKAQKMEELIRVLRNQLGLASDHTGQKEAEIEQLEGEIDGLKKDMEDHEAQITQRHEEEIADLQLTLAKQEAVIECQKAELENLNDRLSKKATELADRNHEHEKITEQMSALQKSFEERESTIIQLSHRVLLEAGHVCLGDNHCQTIENQRTAIAQLRERLTELELAKPPVASHQATLKELSRVRHELMKVKSEMPSAKRGVESTKSTKESVKFQIPLIEESKSHETVMHQLQETLECSERMYNTLVEAICKGMPDLTRCPLEDDDHLEATDDPAKKKQVLKERKKFADTVCRQLNLQAKRQARLQASIKSAEEGKKGALAMEDGEEDGMEEKAPEEVIANLEAVLSATAEELEQQKRLNQSLLKRKNFKESQFNTCMQRPRHKCGT